MTTQEVSSGDWYRNTTAGRPRIEPLTGLRWLAALAVFFSHFVPAGTTPQIITTMCINGYMGVTIFFVLSGFILTVTYHDSLSRPTKGRLGNYAIARVARIYPLYLVVLLWVGAGLSEPLPDRWWLHVFALQTWSPSVVFAYALNGPGWSIGVEFFLYACFPILLVALRRPLRTVRGSAVTLLVVGLLMLAVLAFFVLSGRSDLAWADPASAHRWLYRTPLLRIGDFALGIALAGIFLGLRRTRESRSWAAWMACVSLGLIAVLMMIPSVYGSAASFDVLYAFPAGALILGLALAPTVGLGRVLGSVPMVALGEASYAFYLIHLPVGNRLGAGVLAEGLYPVRVVSFVMTLLFMVALSWGLHVIIERPSRIGLRRIVHFSN